MKIGIPKEVHAGEKRVATTPEVAKQIIKLGFEIVIESGAGAGAHFSDASYVEAGVTVVKNAKEVWDESDIILKVRGPELNPDLNTEEVDLLKENQILISFLFLILTGLNLIKSTPEPEINFVLFFVIIFSFLKKF